MKRWFQALMQIPDFEDPFHAYQARLLNTMILGSLVVTAAGALLYFSTLSVNLQIGANLLLLIILLFSARLLLIRGRLLQAKLLFILAISIYLAMFYLFDQGISIDGGKLYDNDILMDVFPIAVVLAGLLLGPVTGYLAAGLSLILFIGLSYWSGGAAETLAYWGASRELEIHSLLYISLAALAHIFTRQMRNTLESEADSRLALEERNQELEGIRASLEDRVAARTDEIKRQKQFFEALVAHSPLAIVTLDNQSRITALNLAFTSLFGYTLEESLGGSLDNMITTPETWEEAKANTLQVLGGKTIRGSSVRMRKDGTTVEVELYGVPVYVDGEKIGALALYQDISERLRTERALRANEERLRLFFENAAIGMVIINLEGDETLVNPAFSRMVGYPSDEITREVLHAITHSDDQAEDQAYMERMLRGELSTYQHEKRFIHRNGRVVWVSLSASLVRDPSGVPMHFIAQVQDITAWREAQERLEYLATHDPLTGLPNRTLFFDRLEQSLAQAKRHHRRLVVLYADLDGFKDVNDTHGHEAGDLVLKIIGKRLKESCRKSDTVARMGGDEFTMILEEIRSRRDRDVVINKVRRLIEAPVDLGHVQVKVGVSIGSSLYPEQGTTIDELLRQADSRMYQSKLPQKGHKETSHFEMDGEW